MMLMNNSDALAFIRLINSTVLSLDCSSKKASSNKSFSAAWAIASFALDIVGSARRRRLFKIRRQALTMTE